MNVEYEKLIQAIYAGILSPAGWNNLLPRLAGLMDSEQCTFLVYDKQYEIPAFHEVAVINQALVEEYEQHFWQIDPGRPIAAQMQPGAWYFDEQHLGKKVIEHDDFYQAFLRKHGLRSLMSAPLYQDERHLVGLSFQGGLTRRHFNDNDAARIAPLMPHLLEASRLRIQIDKIAKAAMLGTRMLNSFAFPLLAISESSRIVFANTAAEALLSSNELRGASADGRRSAAIKAIIEKISCQIFHRNARCVCTELELASGARCYLLTIRLAEDHPISAGFNERVAMTVLRGTMNLAPDSSQVLRDFFDLTPAETRLVEELQRHDRLTDAADILNITYGTAKTQLKAIFQKTGCHSQASLRQLWLELTSIYCYQN